MEKTYYPKGKQQSYWILVDAKEQNLGRLATQIATYLLGKHKPVYTPGVDGGDFVVVINAKRVNVFPTRLTQKIYYRHSGYPGGLKAVNLHDQLLNHPDRVIRAAVWGMLPHNRLGRRLIKKLRIYPEDNHPHGGQNPQPITQLEKLIIEGTGRETDEGTAKGPEKGIGKEVEKVTGKGTSKVPERRAGKVADKGKVKSPEKRTRKVAEKVTDKGTGKVPEKRTIKATGKASGKGTTGKGPEKKTGKVAGKTTDKATTSKGTQKRIGKVTGKVAGKVTSKRTGKEPGKGTEKKPGKKASEGAGK